MPNYHISAQEAQRGRTLPNARVLLDARACESSLGLFFRHAWNNADEGQRFISNWHNDCIADHLTAVVDREFKGPLIFTMPPRHGKSILNNVFFPAWVWTQPVPEALRRKGIHVQENSWRGPGVTFAYISYDQALSNRDSRKCLALLQSRWYQERWGDRFKLKRTLIEEFTNNAGGKRQALSFAGKVTGFGAHLIFIDDAHNIGSDSYEADRIKILEHWDNALKSRLDDKINGKFIIAMQRSHENDLVGHILARNFDGIHVCLPYEFESRHPFVFLSPPKPIIRQTDTSDGADVGPKVGEPWEDQRKENEVLWHERFPREAMQKDIAEMTSHAAAGQYQQRPTAREGGIFKRVWFENPVKIAPALQKLQLVRSWDLASTEGTAKFDPDYTVGLLMGRSPDTGLIYILDIVRGRYGPADRQNKIRSTAILDGNFVRIRIPQDPASSGKFEAHYLVTQLLSGFSVWTERERGSKEIRVEAFAAQCEHQMVKLVEGPWNEAFVEELCAFPNGTHDDQVDAAAAAFRAITRRVSITAISA